MLRTASSRIGRRVCSAKVRVVGITQKKGDRPKMMHDIVCHQLVFPPDRDTAVGTIIVEEIGLDGSHRVVVVVLFSLHMVNFHLFGFYAGIGTKPT